MTKPIDENAVDLPPAIEAMRQLKWDEEDTPKGIISRLRHIRKLFPFSEKALKYKDEGNHYFKSQKYKVAIISYQEGLKQIFEDNDLYSVLYSNCAAANFHLKNFRTAFKLCIESRKYNNDNIKAIIKGSECCLELKLFEEGLKWCDQGLIVSF
jgi:tetratricopeptide (TPR) repeat protein